MPSSIYYKTQIYRLQSREDISSSSPLIKVLLGLGITVAIVVLTIFILVAMRIRNTQYEPQCSSPSSQFTLRSLFSRRSKRIPRRTSSIKRRSSTYIIFPNNTSPSRNDSTTSTSTTSSSRTVRANGLRLNKELEILGLLTHPADVNSPVYLDTISHRNREAVPTPASHSPPTFPIARLHEEPWWADHDHEEEDEEEVPTRSRQDYPPSPLLPPPPSRSLPPAPAQEQKLQLQPPLNLTPPFNTTKPLPMPPSANEDITPPSPAFTFATRSSGIFPCGAEPSFTNCDGVCALDDTLSEDVLVLPSPPRFAGAYRAVPAISSSLPARPAGISTAYFICSVPQAVSILAIVSLLYGIYYLANSAFCTDIPKISGIPELPNSFPFFGHLKALGSDHASAFEAAYKAHGHGVVQAKLGNRRVLVLNSFAAAQEIIVKNASATIDRPLSYTFHGIVSKTQGGTIGTAPWSEPTKRMRTTAGALMTRPAIQRSAPMLDVETQALVRGLFEATGEGDEVDPRIYFQRLALNLTLVWCYGTRVESVEDPLLHETLRVAHSVSSFRSTNNNIQDYVPFYRYLPASERRKLAMKDRSTRDLWLNELYQKVVDAVAAGKEATCISAGLLKEAKTEFEKNKLTEAEIKSINVSSVSGGFETLATSGLACIAYLSTEHGQTIQEKAYADIFAYHGSVENAWDECLLTGKSPYIVVLVREGLRYYAPLPLLNPRQSTKSFAWRDTTIPSGLSNHINAQSINHDKATYGPDVDIFRPERWLGNSTLKPGPIYQYSFGAGSRMCPAVAISNRVLYATYVRLLVHFKIMASQDMPPVVDHIGFNEDTSGQSAVPKRYRVRLELRDKAGSKKLEAFFGQSKEAIGLST
ncbi:cytochrome P450 [Aspergillus filifer]